MTRIALGRDTSGRPLVLDATTVQRLRAAEADLGFALVVTQGSYMGEHAANASGTTHHGGGVFDARSRAHTTAQKKAVLTALRRVGLIAWLRTKAQGFKEEHYHVVERASSTLSQAAANQRSAFLRGRNGLASNGPDDGPPIDVPTALPAPREEDDMFDNTQERRLAATQAGVHKTYNLVLALLAELRSRDNAANAKEWARFGVILDAIGAATEGLTLAITELDDGDARDRLQALLDNLTNLLENAK